MAKKAKNAEVKMTTTKATATVYIGKSYPGLPQYTVFKNGVLPEHVKEMIGQNEAIQGLIVPVNQLQEARANVNKKGHILYHYASKLK